MYIKNSSLSISCIFPSKKLLPPVAQTHSTSIPKRCLERKNVQQESCYKTRHVFTKPPECHTLVSYQMWFCQKLLKKPVKNASQMVNIWWFLWNPHLITPKSATPDFWRFWAIFGQNHIISDSSPKFRQLEVGNFGATRCGFSLKFLNLDYLTVFWRFWAIFGKTTSCSSPKCDIFNPWEVIVWTRQKKGIHNSKPELVGLILSQTNASIFTWLILNFCAPQKMIENGNFQKKLSSFCLYSILVYSI